jgi:uncharacterized protein YjbJ (UPF0337 family)
MNDDIIKGKWHEVKGKIKQQWGKLTDDDVATMKGSYEELEGRLQKSYGYSKDQVKKQIDEFVDENGWNDNQE